MERALGDHQRGLGESAKLTAHIRFGVLPLVARLMLVAEFLIALNGKITGWEGQAAYMTAKGMHLVAPLLGAALVIEALGSLCLIAGFRTRTAAAVLFGYLGIVTVRLHNFWALTGVSASANQTHFFKNMGMMGGLLMISLYGPGTWAADDVLRRLASVRRGRTAFRMGTMREVMEGPGARWKVSQFSLTQSLTQRRKIRQRDSH